MQIVQKPVLRNPTGRLYDHRKSAKSHKNCSSNLPLFFFRLIKSTFSVVNKIFSPFSGLTFFFIDSPISNFSDSCFSNTVFNSFTVVIWLLSHTNNYWNGECNKKFLWKSCNWTKTDQAEFSSVFSVFLKM